jgi:hypothetical protein
VSTALRRRLQRLEAAMARGLVRTPKVGVRSSDRDLQQAVSKLWDVLEAHYPAEKCSHAGRAPMCKDKVSAAAVRLRAGVPTEQDRAALDAMPKAALCVYGHPAEHFLMAVADMKSLHELTPEQREEVDRYANGLYA